MTNLESLFDELRRIKLAVDSIIMEKILPKKSTRQEIQFFYDMMRDYPSRPAKGIRPFLCVQACKALGGDEGKALLTAACIELFQHWVLIHDDIEDDSELRRGKQTLHKKYSVPLALNVGDALHARMWEGLLGNVEILGESKTIQVMREFTNIVNETTEGQHIELTWIDQGRWDLDEEDYLEMCRKKTSFYTVAGPCRLGGIIADAPDDVLNELLSFGVDLGIGFQIQDDTLNLTADQGLYGKESYDDILEGKRTLIMIRLLKVADGKDRERIIRALSKKRNEKTSSDVQMILSMIEKYRVLDYTSSLARDYVERALRRFERIEWKGNANSVSMLKMISKFMVERKW